MAAVPHTDEVEGAREHASFEDTEEEACCEKARVALYDALEHGDEAKAEHANGEPDSRLELLQDDLIIRWLGILHGFSETVLTLEGISKRMYGTKKMTKAML